MEFGKQIRTTAFALAEHMTFTNHGAFGAVPRCVKDSQKRLIDEMDASPSLWFRKTSKLKLDEARTCIAEFISADPDDVVFVQNITKGVNSVMGSLILGQDDIILCNNHNYTSVKNVCSRLSHLKGVHIVSLQIHFPIHNEDDVVEMYRQYFLNNKNVKIAMLDHISCSSAIKWPIEKLIPLCREFGVLSLVDGAHAPGQIPLNLKDLDPDFYMGNLHKWLFCPRGCAILYVKKKHQGWVKPALLGLSYNSSFQKDFLDQGCCDETPFCVVPEAIQFYKEIGGYEKIKAYVSPLLNKVVNEMVAQYGTEKLAIPESMEAPFMKMIRLPSIDIIDEQKTYSEDELDILMAQFIERFKIDASFSFVEGKAYHRCHCNVYNTKDDYIKMMKAIQQLRI